VAGIAWHVEQHSQDQEHAFARRTIHWARESQEFTDRGQRLVLAERL
jgi:hypothetical protein